MEARYRSGSTLGRGVSIQEARFSAHSEKLHGQVAEQDICACRAPSLWIKKIADLTQGFRKQRVQGLTDFQKRPGIDWAVVWRCGYQSEASAD